MQNKDVTVDLIFDVCGTSVTWLSVKTSTIPNSGKGCFLRFDGKEGQLVSCFMGYKVPSAKASIYAFRNIEPCRKSKEDPFLWCFAHFIQHGSLDDANVCVDNEGGIALLRNVKGKDVQQNYSWIIIVMRSAKNAVKRCTRQTNLK